MQFLPKSTHLWSDGPSVSPGCCSGATLLLSFPWYVPDFRKITTRAADGSLSGITPWRALVLCFQMSPVFQSEICGSCTAGLLFDGISSYSFLIFGSTESCAIHWSLFPFKMKQCVLQHDLKRSTQQKKDKKLKTSFTIFNFMLKNYSLSLKSKNSKTTLKRFFFFLPLALCTKKMHVKYISFVLVCL